jgi:hypothetical protein
LLLFFTESYLLRQRGIIFFSIIYIIILKLNFTNKNFVLYKDILKIK